MKHFTNLMIGILLSAQLVGCNAKPDGDENTAQEKERTSSIGPFDMQVSDSSTAPVLNTFKVENLIPNDGRVDFNFKASQATRLRFNSATWTTTGCDANQIKVTYLWVDLDADRNITFIHNNLKLKDVFDAPANSNRTLVVAFEKLNGCKSLGFTMEVQRVLEPAPPGTWDPAFDPKLVGTWEWNASDNKYRILLMIDANGRVGWLEANAINYTCDTSFLGMTDTLSTPNWISRSTGGLDCTYSIQDPAAARPRMTLSCYSPNKTWGCRLPMNAVFIRD